MTTPKLKLAHLIHLDGPGGGPLSVINQLAMLAPYYHQTVIHGGAGRLADYCDRAGYPHEQIDIDRKRRLPAGFWQTWRALRRIRPDVLVLHGQWGGALGALAGWLARVPHRVYIVRWPYFYADWDLLRCLRNFVAEQVPARFCHRIIFLTESSRYQFMLRHRVPAERMTVVPNSTAAEDLPTAERVAALRAAYGFDRHACNVVSVGRLEQQKRCDWLIDAWPRVLRSCPDAHLWIVGQGKLKPDLVKRAASLGLDGRITWIEDDAHTGAEFIAAGDLLAHTALFETFGNVILEAFIAGKPVVATSVDGPRSIVSHGEDGLLVPPGDIPALADALVRLIQDSELRTTMGERARRTAEEYRPDRIAPRWLAAIRPETRPLMTHVLHHDGEGGGPPIIVSLMRNLNPWCRQSAICGGRGLIARHCERQGLPYSAIRLTRRRLWGFAGLPLWRKLRRLRPEVLVVHGQPAAPVAALIGRLAGVRRLIYVAQWPAFYTDWDVARLLRNRLSEWVPCRLADVVVTFTPSSRHQYLLRKLAAPSKIISIPPALFDDAVPDADRVKAVRRRHGWSAYEQHVVSVGRLADQKDLDQLLHAWIEVRRAVPTARLWIVGDGGDGPRLKDVANGLGIADRCHFVGHRDDARAYIAAADVLVITSMYESFGYVALEACACGTPMVASRVDGLVDVIQDRVEGFLAPPGDTATLAARVIELLRDPNLRKAMGEAGRRRAAAFSPHNISQRWLDLLQNRLQMNISRAPLTP